ncbi:hypothetical protein FRC09_009072 [Ceratobasidium sp. 395]|nr:hypothetical protein FRC09_009072 [Ceratobasidium sp. 395]
MQTTETNQVKQSPQEDLKSAPGPIVVHNDSSSNLYALIIGINVYRNESLRRLAGAVPDADSIKDFISTDLKVPDDHIINLRDEQATREEIIQAFGRLRDNTRIHKGDPILIYYAGHGGKREAAAEWKEKYGYEEIQVIFPHDYNTLLPASEELENCIPDRTIGMLLNDRNEAISGRVTREAEAVLPIPNDIDLDIFPANAADNYYTREIPGESRRTELPLYMDQASHVHLAACGSEEKAWEEDGRGDFTKSLLRYIRASGVDKISYQNLIVSLPMLPKQTPHCYGVHKSRILFNSQVPSRKSAFVPAERESGTWMLQAGAASGVTQGSIWELHAKPVDDSEPLGRLEADTPQVSLTALHPILESGYNMSSTLVSISENRLYARQIRVGSGSELRVYFSPEAKELVFHGSQPPSAVGLKEYEVGYVVYQARDSADLVVEVYHPEPAQGSHEPSTEVEVEYTICHPHLEKYGVSKLRRRTRARMNEVECVVFAAARWNWYLQWSNPSTRPEPTVSMELVNVGRSFIDRVIPVEGSLNTGVVDIKARGGDKYGIRLANLTPDPLYVGAFYFDPNDFSIVYIFGVTQGSNRQDLDLPGGKHIIIGDAANGGSPLTFRLDEGVEIEVGFLKRQP